MTSKKLDPAAILAEGKLQSLTKLLDIVHVARDRRLIEKQLARPDLSSEDQQVCQRELDELPAADIMQGLAAANRLIERLERHRRWMVGEARGDQVSWAKLAAVLDVTPQSAWEKYHLLTGEDAPPVTTETSQDG